MAQKGVYTFTLKKKELVAVVAGIIVTYVMVFLLGYTLGKESTPVVSEVAVGEYQSQEEASQQSVPPPPPVPPAEEPEQSPPPPAEVKLPIQPAPSRPAPQEKTLEQKVKPEVEIPVKPIKKPEKPVPFRYFVQAGAFSKASSARSLKCRLKKKGYRVQVMKVGSLYKVLIGPYTTEKEAIEAKKKLVRDERIYGYIVKY